jgi:hypothetical protein
MDSRMTDVDVATILNGPPPRTPEQATAAFRKALEELCETQSGLALRMQRLGDRRPLDTILRGIQRMASGETRVSGEMLVILEMMNRERQRAKYEASKLPWANVANGCVTTKTRDFTISLSPQSRGRWLVNLVHVDGYSPPWPAWQSYLDEAKIKSLLCLDDALADMQYHQQWAKADQAKTNEVAT